MVGIHKRREVTEYDNYDNTPVKNTPENRKRAAEAKEELLLFAQEIEKKYSKK